MMLFRGVYWLETTYINPQNYEEKGQSHKINFGIELNTKFFVD